MLKVLFSCYLSLSLIWCISLDSLYQLAQPGEGYDKLLTLDSFQIYEGGITAEVGKKTCIHGYGAIIDLDGGTVRKIAVRGAGTVLDIERCVIINGEIDSAALVYTNSAFGTLDHLTMAGNYDGIRFWHGESLSLKNSIIVNSDHYGMITIDSCLGAFQASYNDLWNNQYGNYVCWFSGC